MVFIGDAQTEAEFRALLNGVAFKGGNIEDIEHNNTIYDENGQHVPSSILEHNSININGTEVSLGGSITVSGGSIDLADAEEGTFGTNDDISIRYAPLSDSFVWQDNINDDDIAEIDRTSGDMSIEGSFELGSKVSFTSSKIESSQTAKVSQGSSAMTMGEIEVAGNLIVNGDLSVN